MEPYCPPIASSVRFAADCSFNLKSVNCMEVAKPGTVAAVTCKYGYESGNITTSQETTCGINGQWHPIPMPCTQKCGEQTIESANIQHVPWHASIYKRSSASRIFAAICSGTILSAKTVISAAQCFWNEREMRYYDSTEFSN